jgi:tetratricopeptide (TPR) repeat protein
MYNGASVAVGIALMAAILLVAGPAEAVAHQGLHEAIAGVTKRIQDEPRNPSLYLARADLHRQHADFDAALADCDQAAGFAPDLPEVDLARGRVLLDAGWLASAELATSRFVERRPEQAGGHEVLGEILHRRGDHARAAGEFARAIELESRPSPELYLARARALVASDEADEQVVLAIRCLDEGMKRLGKPIISLQVYAIELEMRRQQYDAALARVQTLAEQSERQEQWQLQRGDILRRAGRASQAIEAYREALASIERLSPARRQTLAVLVMADHARIALSDLQATLPATRPSERKEKSDASLPTSRPAR